MKYLLTLLIFIISLTGFSKTETDTIMNWQLYLDDKIILQSHIMDPQVHSITIDSAEDFKELKLVIRSDMPRQNIRRKLMFKLGDQLVSTHIKIVREASEPLIIQKEDLIAIGPFLNNELTIVYTDSDISDEIILGKILIKK